jgi:NAD(P)-dependent dehydrogenase (short-subunit alcohol dehydrogenase family)
METSVAIVTGASQGIGRSTAIRLARDFAALVLVARDRANLESTAEAVKAAGAKALVIECDLSQPEAAKSVVDQALAAFGRIDALLNIAGAVPQSASGAIFGRAPQDGLDPRDQFARTERLDDIVVRAPDRTNSGRN